jgi:hypothetical protein
MKIKNKLFIYLFICLLVYFFVAPPANATISGVDLGMTQYSLAFTQETDSFVEGQQIRVYVSVGNFGDQDGSGEVFIYRDAQLIGTSPVSVKAKGVEDEVFADFVVPEHDFRMYFELKGITPEDQNASNNQLLAPLYKIDQDTDNDGIGNRTDVDDDNDGLNDEAELPLGTDPLNKDTDNDGVIDSLDAFPLDPTRYKEDVPKPVVQTPPPVADPADSGAPTPAPAPAPKPSQPVSSAANSVGDELTEPELIEEFYKVPDMDMLREIHIVAAQVNWNTFNFDFATNLSEIDSDNFEYLWIYGDGKESSVNGNHSFNSSGEYYVTLKVKGPLDNFYYDSIKVTVDFWSVYNYWLWLIVLAIVLVLFLFGSSIKHKSKPEPQERDEFVAPLKKKRKKVRPKTKKSRQQS